MVFIPIQYSAEFNVNLKERTERFYIFHILLRNHLNDPDLLKPMLNPVYELNNSILRPTSAPQALVCEELANIGVFSNYVESQDTY